jgi:uncharacterized membrane protein
MSTFEPSSSPQPTPSAEADEIQGRQPSNCEPNLTVNFDKWIEHFYKECGREVTLAYTTLNQMKNWAIAIVAAFVSAIVTLGKPAQAGQDPTLTHLGIYTAAVLAYVFNLRFFIRSILCYINLVRWNRLQSDIVKTYLTPGTNSTTAEEAKKTLRDEIDDYYHRWRSPITRKEQLVQNLKLGFALVLALPLFFVAIWSVEFWDLQFVRGLLVFLIGATLVEFADFARSSYFDTPQKAASRKRDGGSQIFPVPVTRGGYLITWTVNLLLSTAVALWPSLMNLVKRVFGC